jgi:hypothetical protein
VQARRGCRADALGGEVPSGAAAACCVLRGAGAAITLLYGVSDGIHDEHKARLAFLKNSPGEASADQDPSVPGPSRTRRRAVLHLAYKYGASDARGARGAEAAQTGPERSNGEAERSNRRVQGTRTVKSMPQPPQLAVLNAPQAYRQSSTVLAAVSASPLFSNFPSPALRRP